MRIDMLNSSGFFILAMIASAAVGVVGSQRHWSRIRVAISAVLVVGGLFLLNLVAR